MNLFLKILMIVGIVLVAFFVLTFIVYIFNLDMKLTAKLEPLFAKHYDKVKKDKKL